MIGELELIEKKDLRDEYVGRVEVLEKVKALLLLPDIELGTTQQVADFYEVKIGTLYSLIHDNLDEIESDGYVVWKANDFKTSQNEGLKTITMRGGFNVEFSNGYTQKFSPRGIGLFTRRAILRVGMLLRDSEVAKEVRTQLLNIEEKTTTEQKVQEINEEQEIVLQIVYGEDEIDRANATRELLNYKNRHLQILENKNKVLTDGTLTWKPRESVNNMVRKIAFQRFGNRFGSAWDKVYSEMLYKHNISINARKTKSKLKKPTVFDVLNDDEVKLLARSCLSLCEMYKINTDDLLVEL